MHSRTSVEAAGMILSREAEEGPDRVERPSVTDFIRGK